MIKENRKGSISCSFGSILYSIVIFLCGLFLGLIFNSSSTPSPPSTSTSLTTTTTPISPAPSSHSSSIITIPQCNNLIEKYVVGNRSAAYKKLKSRKELPEYLNLLGLVNEGVEVGVKDGAFSNHVLKYWNGKKYHLVDPWLEQDEEVYKDIANVCPNPSSLLFHPLPLLLLISLFRLIKKVKIKNIKMF